MSAASAPVRRCVKPQVKRGEQATVDTSGCERTGAGGYIVGYTDTDPRVSSGPTRREAGPKIPHVLNAAIAHLSIVRDELAVRR